jgi:hypothetical protein
VPAEVEPPELARLVAFAERSRVGDWSLRSALMRYAQPEPQRVSDVLESVRRVESALHAGGGRLAKEGPVLWQQLEAGSPDDQLVGVLAVAAELDALGDVLAGWAADRSGATPTATVDATITAAAARLDELGVAREERVPPPGARSRG